MSGPADALPAVFLSQRCVKPEFELPNVLKKYIEHEVNNKDWNRWISPEGEPVVYTSYEEFKVVGDKHYYVIKKMVTRNLVTNNITYEFEVKRSLRPLFQDNNDPYFPVDLTQLDLIRK